MITPTHNFEVTFIDDRPALNLISDWTKLVKEGVRREEERIEKLRQEALKEPLPQLTGEEWVRRVADAMKTVMALPLTESFDFDHPARRALEVVMIQAEAAGWRITIDDGRDESQSHESVTREYTVTFDYAAHEKNSINPPA